MMTLLSGMFLVFQLVLLLFLIREKSYLVSFSLTRGDKTLSRGSYIFKGDIEGYDTLEKIKEVIKISAEKNGIRIRRVIIDCVTRI